MGCYGATRECLRNCCGGPRSENYDAWLARERLRQLNHQTQRADQLNRQNVQLEMALNQTQDILTSYRDLDIYDGGETPEGTMSLTAAHISQSAGQRGGSNPPSRAPSLSQHSADYRAQSFPPIGLERRQASVNLDLASAPQNVRRDQLRPQSAARVRPAQQPPALQRPSTASGTPHQVTYEVPSPKLGMSRGPAALGIAAVPEDAPLDRGALDVAKSVTAPPALANKTPMTPEARRATLAELKASVARLPNVSPSVRSTRPGPTPFGSPTVQPDVGHARTHGYRPS